MISRPVLASLVLLVGCAEQSGGGDCELATAHVASCYGDETAVAFGESCTPEGATAALAEQCGTAEDGKADSASTPILYPAVEHFKYGSIGADKMGMPLALLKAIPVVCRDLLPLGTDPYNRPLEAFGMIYESGKELPIGFSSKKLPLIGMTLVGNTCSSCHTATVRATPTSQRTMYFGAPNTRFDLEKYNDFLFRCISDSTRFNKTRLNTAFDYLNIRGMDRLLAYGSSFFRAYVGTLQTKFDSVVSDGPWGPGRDDAIGLSGAMLLGPEHLPTTPAPVDFPSVWNQNARKGHALHWDGASPSAFERNVLVSVGAGTPRNMVPIASINAIQSWLDTLPAPKYPFAIDMAKVTAGAALFGQHCASCHAANGSRTWSVIPLSEIRTDPNRVNVVTPSAIAAMNNLSGAGWQFDQFRKTDGYATGILDGIWLRAPYLHNGSVPTLRDLLLPAAQRPAAFYRGNDTYDATNVGFASTVAREGNASYMLFDTSLSGNSNAGHEYGTSMTDAERDALVEYMKTL